LQPTEHPYRAPNCGYAPSVTHGPHTPGALLTPGAAARGLDPGSIPDAYRFHQYPRPERRRVRPQIQLLEPAYSKLADLGLVEYDPRSETIRYRGDPLVETLLDDLPE